MLRNNELFTMWSNTRMIVLTAVVAALYVCLLLPFKGLVIIPGYTEIRPAALVPLFCSLLFGPAAAWGAAIGNLVDHRGSPANAWRSAVNRSSAAGGNGPFGLRRAHPRTVVASPCRPG